MSGHKEVRLQRLSCFEGAQPIGAIGFENIGELVKLEDFPKISNAVHRHRNPLPLTIWTNFGATLKFLLNNK